MSNYSLTPKHKKAIQLRGKPILIVAGPGTGKSTTLRERVKSLLKEKECNEIVLISFTNASADDLQKELDKEKINDARIKVFTLHRLAKHCLHKNPSAVGLRESFIVTSSDIEERFIAQEAIDELGIAFSLDDLVNNLRKFKATGDSSILLMKWFKDIINRYDELLLYYNATDFHGLILLVCELMEEHDKDKYRIQNLLVDEYQDLNPMEQKAVKLFSGDSKGLVVVGDDDQSIYGFKFADHTGILKFKAKYLNAEVIEFDSTGRCPQRILDVAQAVIAKNPTSSRYQKQLKSVAPVQPGEVFLVSCPQAQAEAQFIVDKIQELHNNGISYQDFLVLCYGGCRNEIVKGLGNSAIPIFIRKSKKPDLDIWKIYIFARVVANPLDSLAVHQCLLHLQTFTPRPLLLKIRGLAEKQKMDLLDYLKTAHCKGLLSEKQGKYLKKFQRDIDLIGIMCEKEEIEKASMSFVNRFMLSKKKFSPFKKFIKSGKIKDFKSLVETIQRQEGILEKEADETMGSEGDAVQIMSIHSAKGLNAEVVFIPGFEKGILPRDDSNVEEQRRLFYVAVTRARQKVYLLHSRVRKGRAAKGSFAFTEVSPFLKDIPNNLLTTLKIPSKRELDKSIKIARIASL